MNVEISIETERQSKTEEEVLLTFKIIFKKGNTDTLQIKGIKAKVNVDENGVREFTFPEIHKLKAENNMVKWDSIDPNKNISLSPGESFHFGRYVRVPKDAPILVEVVMHGTRTMWGKGCNGVHLLHHCP